MLRRIVTILAVVILLPAFLSAQEKTVLRADGKIIKHTGDVKTLEVQPIRDAKLGILEHQNDINKFSLMTPNSPDGTIDTLGFPGPWDSNFGFFGQDWFVGWFECPANLTIKQVGFACFENVDAQNAEVKIVKVNWSREELMSMTAALRGYYPAVGNGYNDITAFLDNEDRTGDWVSFDGGTEPFGNDLWSDDGAGAPVLPVGNNPAVYQWVDMDLLGFEPELLAGDIFAIAIKHVGPDMDANRTGMWAGGAVGFPSFKLYANGRLLPGEDFGWWSRLFTWDFVAEVDLTGDRAPVINSFATIPSGPDLGPFTVDANITDDNPGDPPDAGVASAILMWSIDDGTTWNDVAMTGTEPAFTGDIPAQVANTTVDYKIIATDVNGLISESVVRSFFVFGPSGASTLVIFNGLDGVSGYPQSYYWGSDIASGTSTFDHDRWAYGEMSAVVVNNYTNVIEIATNGPGDINNDVIRAWLEADGNRNYMLAGDEWLGSQSGWVDGPHVAGSFHFDILGINFEHNDIGTGGSAVNPVYAQTGTLLGGPIFDKWTQVSTDSGWTSDMMYDPNFEISVANWLDGVDFEADVEVDMKGMSIRSSDSSTVHNIAGHRTLTAGNKIAFFTYDPLSLNSSPEYWWYGYEANAPQGEVLSWFGIAVAVEQENNLLPEEYSLSQNYPNPFNPSTTINFSVPKHSKVVLKVYDILGSEVASLVNETLDAGNYTTNFDASQFASGMYVYRITAGNFVTAKKMMLLK